MMPRPEDDASGVGEAPVLPETEYSSKLRPAVAPPAADATRLLAPVDTLPGIGPALAGRFAAYFGVPRASRLDLAWLFPRERIELATMLGTVPPAGQPVSLEVEIIGHRAAGHRRAPFVVTARSRAGPLELVFFHGARIDHGRRWPVGTVHHVLGRLEQRGGRWQIVHPKQLSPREAGAGWIGRYPAIPGVAPATLRKLVGRVLDELPEVPEWLPGELLRRQGWPDWRGATLALHHSGVETECQRARRRLAFDELLAFQLRLRQSRERRRRRRAAPIRGDGELRRRLLAALPFRPTADQDRAAAEIAADLAQPHPMRRLLQGEVGSGKTLVAMLALLAAVETGRQGVFLAPTDLLARQHHATLAAWAGHLGVDLVLLTGSDAGPARASALAGLAAGRVPLAVGTHALLQPDVAFADLAIAVVDEQHRFGVGQRQLLLAKGSGVGLLLMSATPIPRTLLLSLYGDLACSSLRTRPPGRRPVATRALPERRLDEVVEACARALEQDRRIYWICPLVEDHTELGDAAAERRYRQLRERFGNAVDLAHGRQKPAVRAAALAGFAEGRTRLLVATTVVEVGVDIPEASIIVIEGAERFGLAQLHQLRGRVGRGEIASTCLLVYGEPLTATGRARLEAIRNSDDGFALAEADLELRGPGEVLGTRQSGLPEFRFADLALDRDLLAPARDLAALPHDAATRERLRLLLQLYPPRGASAQIDGS